jgi:hypothetical protein
MTMSSISARYCGPETFERITFLSAMRAIISFSYFVQLTLDGSAAPLNYVPVLLPAILPFIH